MCVVMRNKSFIIYFIRFETFFLKNERETKGIYTAFSKSVDKENTKKELFKSEKKTEK